MLILVTVNGISEEQVDDVMDSLITSIDDYDAHIVKLVDSETTEYKKEQLKNAVIMQLQDDLENKDFKPIVDLLNSLLDDSIAETYLKEYINETTLEDIGISIQNRRW